MLFRSGMLISVGRGSHRGVCVTLNHRLLWSSPSSLTSQGWPGRCQSAQLTQTEPKTCLSTHTHTHTHTKHAQYLSHSLSLAGSLFLSTQGRSVHINHVVPLEIFPGRSAVDPQAHWSIATKLEQFSLDGPRLRSAYWYRHLPMAVQEII